MGRRIVDYEYHGIAVDNTPPKLDAYFDKVVKFGAGGRYRGLDDGSRNDEGLTHPKYAPDTLDLLRLRGDDHLHLDLATGPRPWSKATICPNRGLYRRVYGMGYRDWPSI